ncbi:hypothetical protein GIB67_042206 [Kingdonia uniflora]|uniref:Cytochrome P450 n=1 Tax=Kingdonia uniflora TaxID=39325 RepID=A0A7J7LDT9_9MAGN|nr:hypothetical protein GIB67_042206 [Kingdonia uniflora]
MPSTKLNLPPSPPKLPLIGHLHHLRPFLHRSCQDLSNKYGPIMLLHLGHAPFLIVSSPDTAKKVMMTQDSEFADRPFTSAAKAIMRGYTNVNFAPYGEYWRQGKKLFGEGLLNVQRVQSFKHVREEEVALLMLKISPSCSLQTPVNLGEMVRAFISKLAFRCAVTTTTQDGHKLAKMYTEVGTLMGAFSFEDFYPSLGWMDDLLLGSDDAATSLEWAFTELFNKPSAMKKAQEEVRRVVGMKSKLDEEDIHQMGYVKCVVREALRLHPPGPTLVPRINSKGTKVNGYDIPANTTVLINVWAIQRDPKLWDNAEEFIPERFTNKMEIKSPDHTFIPFGTGKRSCPGSSFGLAIVELCLANLLFHFDWKLPGDLKELDMTEGQGFAISKRTPLQLIPISHAT